VRAAVRAAIALGLLLAPLGPARAQSVAVTLDDGPRLAETPRLSPQARNQALLDALARHHVRAALFVTLANGADRPEGLRLARAWGEAGHLIGNHTVTHLDLDAPETTLERYTGEILACDEVIRRLPGFRPWFRFTYLREGNTPEKRDGLRAFLHRHGLRNAHVTLDTSDWRLDAALRARLAARPDADLAPFRQVYLAHVRQRAEAYRDLSRRLFGRDVPQVLLLHHSLLNALFLDDVLGQFERLGWTFTDPEQAYQDFVYTLAPERAAPGQSLLLSAARSLGHQVEGRERLVDDGDFEIEALRALGVAP
jgi:peptidoglycan/xylan/chitin deacetylase (PgdA/CDA1 family)